MSLHRLILLNAGRAGGDYRAVMAEENHELARLKRRIADVRSRIEDAKARDSQAWSRSARIEILDLLGKTLEDLEARKIMIERRAQ